MSGPTSYWLPGSTLKVSPDAEFLGYGYWVTPSTSVVTNDNRYKCYNLKTMATGEYAISGENYLYFGGIAQYTPVTSGIMSKYGRYCIYENRNCTELLWDNSYSGVGMWGTASGPWSKYNVSFHDVQQYCAQKALGARVILNYNVGTRVTDMI